MDAEVPVGQGQVLRPVECPNLCRRQVEAEQLWSSIAGPVCLTCLPDSCAEGGSQGPDSGFHEDSHLGEQGQEQRSVGSSGSSASSGRSEGWGSGGELVSMSDLQFSRIIGEVGRPASLCTSLQGRDESWQAYVPQREQGPAF